MTKEWNQIFDLVSQIQEINPDADTTSINMWLSMNNPENEMAEAMESYQDAIESGEVPESEVQKIMQHDFSPEAIAKRESFAQIVERCHKWVCTNQECTFGKLGGRRLTKEPAPIPVCSKCGKELSPEVRDHTPLEMPQQFAAPRVNVTEQIMKDVRIYLGFDDDEATAHALTPDDMIHLMNIIVQNYNKLCVKKGYKTKTIRLVVEDD